MSDRSAVPPERKPGWPDANDDVINLYGTYEVQDTANTDNRYPMIAQGMPTQCKDTFRDSHPRRNENRRQQLSPAQRLREQFKEERD